MRNSNASPSLGLLFSTATALVSPAHETIVRAPLYGLVPPLTVRSTIGSAMHSLLSLFSVWQRRASERKQLGQLDEHMLEDIGLEKFQIAQELEKPFWMP